MNKEAQQKLKQFKGRVINGDCMAIMKEMPDNSVDSICCDPPYGWSFMGKSWDYDIPTVELWQEVLRVLKPGGHALVACGTRTQHRMAVNLEDAGFELKNIIVHCYGSGFPKSQNIYKTLQKKGVENIEQYQGLGSALKPAVELWSLVRKPLSEKTIADNVLRWGTGGINIDECRIDYQSEYDKNQATPQGKCTSNVAKGAKPDIDDEGRENFERPEQKGRFPANLIHSGEKQVTDLFPNSGSGNNKKSYNYSGREYNNKETSMFNGDKPQASSNYNESGSASRFFKQCKPDRLIYCPKAGKKERNFGCDGLEKKGKVFNGQSTKPSKEVKDVEARFNTQPTANNHPAVKPVTLMCYLTRLITPKEGTCLDPFAGSGSTGIACKLEGFKFIGIEREEDYCEIARARIKAWVKEPRQQSLLNDYE